MIFFCEGKMNIEFEDIFKESKIPDAIELMCHFNLLMTDNLMPFYFFYKLGEEGNNSSFSIICSSKKENHFGIFAKNDEDSIEKNVSHIPFESTSIDNFIENFELRQLNRFDKKNANFETEKCSIIKKEKNITILDTLTNQKFSIYHILFLLKKVIIDHDDNYIGSFLDIFNFKLNENE